MITITVDVDKGSLPQRLRKFASYIEAGLVPAWSEIASQLDRAIKAMVPVDTGVLYSSIRTTYGPMKVYSLASAIDGQTGYNYARIQHDGGFASGKYGPHNIEGVQYMYIPLHYVGNYVAPEILNREIARIIALCGLG